MITILETIKEFEGNLISYKHDSAVCACSMHFSVYLPPQAERQKVPALYWLSGLTCTDENFKVKAGAQRYAAELGIALIIPDTSPRGESVADEDNYDFGQGAGFYLNAKQEPWSTNYKMYDYITKELPVVLAELGLPLNGKQSISGHSMGGHGALTIALKNAKVFSSVSAFSPICNPTESPWGIKAFTGYIGSDKNQWREYDSTCLVTDGAEQIPMLVDQGTADEFYPEQLLSDNFIKVCDEASYSVTFRMQEGYDHSFHFIATFIGEHIKWHKKHLNSQN